jgi:hypothetical protein
MTWSEFDDVVARIMLQLGCDRTKAEAAARLNGYKPAVEIDNTRDDTVLEKEEQAYISRLFREFGLNVRNLSQARKTKQAPGLPDLWCMHRELPIAFWWETKRQIGGRLSDAQVEFKSDCERCHVGYGTGDRHAARNHLIKLGLARVVGDTLEPIHRADVGAVA